MSPTVFVVDDSDFDRQTVLETLQACAPGAKLFGLNDGAEVLEYLDRRDRDGTGPREDPNLILLDLHMPRAGGIEVLRRVKADPVLKQVPVVIFSSSQLESDVRLCYELQVNAYAVKPGEFSEFKAAVRAIAGFWLNLNRTAPVSTTGANALFSR